jgi:hypothetical protein
MFRNSFNRFSIHNIGGYIMSDSTPIVGMIGTGLSFTLGQWNDLVGLCAGSLTCIYMVWKLYKFYKYER